MRNGKWRRISRRLALMAFVAVLASISVLKAAGEDDATVKILARPLPGARIERALFGNFMELLDDVVPGCWAEMLNDRCFAGVLPAADWVYYDGSLDICDRTWDANRTWIYETNNTFVGARCVKLTAGEEAASLTQTGLAVRKGMNYKFSTYVRGDSNVRITALLKVKLPTGEWFTLASAEIPSALQNWEKRSIDMTANGDTDRAVFELRVEGHGNIWVNKLSLMPGDNRQGWRADVVEAIKEISPGIVRWGGSAVDPGNYQWKKGIGDRDWREPWKNENWGRIDSNDVGLDEFCQFCEATGCEPLVCVSFSDGPESGRDLAEYLNGAATTQWGARRAANGHPEPYNVKFWEIGNEINGNDERYLAQFPAFIKGIRAVDPSAQIMTSYPSQRLLDRVGREVNFVCPHFYTTDLNEWEMGLTRLSRMIDSTPDCAGVKIGVTEWNIDSGAWGLGRARQATLIAALENAEFLNIMMRHSDKVKIANRSNLANSYCGATILTAATGWGVLRQASHYVMKLYSRHAKPIPLSVETYNHRLDVFACASDDLKSTAIFVVNPGDQPAEFAADFQGFNSPVTIASAECVRDVENRRQPDVENHWGEPERIKILPLPMNAGRTVLPPFSASVLEATAK